MALTKTKCIMMYLKDTPVPPNARELMDLKKACEDGEWEQFYSQLPAQFQKADS